MNCKKCGGELIFQNGISICQSCGSTFSLESIYENIDIYICYVENDASGRRTKDSIIAQQVYKKLEDAKISTFFERITSAGISGDDLEANRYAAIQKAKAVIVLATSVENFNVIVEKYNSYLENKNIIPFCVDVNPGSLPKTLGKIQAIDYTAIGWEKDLINGLYNLLGKEKDVNINSLYANTRKKRVVIISILLVVALLISVVTFLIFRFGDIKNNGNANSQDTTQTQSLTQNETYDKAMDLLNQGKNIDALNLFYQIPEHANSGNMIKQIYAKYEGYYKNGDTSLHIEIFDNVRAEIEIITNAQNKTIKITESTTVSVNNIVFDYADSQSNKGKAKIQLEDSGIRLELTSDSQAENINAFFAIAEKSDQPFLQIDAQTLISWLENEVTIDQIRSSGYDLEQDGAWGLYSPVYKIKDTNIFLLVYESGELVSINAPAKIIEPSLIGKECEPVFEEDIIYCPNSVFTGFSTGVRENPDGCHFTSDVDEFVELSKKVLTSDTIIGENTTLSIVILPDSTDEMNIYFVGDLYEMDIYHYVRPNVFCPDCGWGTYLTGWSTDEFPCGNCGTNFDPFNSETDISFSWVKEATTIEDLQQMGYEIILEYSSPRMYVDERYRIKNTDIQLFSVRESTYISAILAPAELLIPDYIGNPGNQFYINDVLVIPNATEGGNNIFIPYIGENDDIITENTPVLILTKTSFNTAVCDGGWGESFDELY